MKDFILCCLQRFLSLFQDKEIEGEGDYLSERCGSMGDEDEIQE